MRGANERTFVSPFPWADLESLSRNEVLAGAKMRDISRRFVESRKVMEVLATLLGLRTEALLKTVREASPAQVPENGLGVLLAPADKARTDHAVLVMVEPALAATLVAKALGRPTRSLWVPNATPSYELIGGLAAIVRAVAAKAHLGSAPVILSAGPAGHLFLDVARTGTAHTALFTVLVDDDAFSASIVLDTRTLPPPDTSTFTSAHLASMGTMPLALSIVAATCLATVDDLSRLTPGDVLLTGVFPATDSARHERRGMEHATYRGRVVLCAPQGDTGIVCDLRDSEALVLSAERVAMPLVARDVPASSHARGGFVDSNDIPTDVLADVPIVVRVELGLAELPASAWAKTRAGDVIALGRKIGEPVVLRVSGTEVARGELVHVEGELAVRILSRTGEHSR